MQSNISMKRPEKDPRKGLSGPEDKLLVGEMERVRAEIARLQLQVEKISAAFDRH